MAHKSSPGSTLRARHWIPSPPSLLAPGHRLHVEPYLSLVSAYYHPSTSSNTPNGQPILSPSTSVHQSEDYVPFPQGPNHSSKNNLYADTTVSPAVQALLKSRHLRVAQPSITISQSAVSTYPSDSIYPRRLQRQASTYEGQLSHGRGMFYGSHHFTIQGGTFGDNAPDDFMEKLLQNTIIGAEYDSSDRHPPPRCHPGTRLAVVERCRVFIADCNGKEKMRWVVGPAGVGKSAIMQMVAEETPADASVFFSVNGRRDGTKTFNTIAYQLAAKYEPYRQFISKEIIRDPALLRKALPAQFQKFIVDPFIQQSLFKSSDRFVVIIDGLDECDSPATQQELLELISDFCLVYPTSPIVWFLASRPEPHITSFFDEARIAHAYSKEEIMIDSDEACEDVQRYLRAELNGIKIAYSNLRCKREWPSEHEFTKIATAAGGLFAYASTVVRYIGDPHYGDPVSQLDDVLKAIDVGPKDDTSRRNNPLALLDALYDRIMSKIPDGALINTRKLLLVHSNDERWYRDNFRLQCNRVGLTEDAAYGAVRHLHAVVKVPAPDKVDNESLTYFHKSFEDFLFNFKRSGFSRNIRGEVDQLMAQSSLRVVEQVPDDYDGMARGEVIECYDYGYLKGSFGFCDDISLSWPGNERLPTTDHQLRCQLYSVSMKDICREFRLQNKFFSTIPCFHALTTRVTALGYRFPIQSVRDSVFDKFRAELMDLGKLRQVPLRKLDYAAICGAVVLRFTSPVGMNLRYFDPWNPICKHRKEDVDGLQHWRGWTSVFERSLTGPRIVLTHAGIPQFNIKAGKDSHWEACVRGGGGGGAGEDECVYCLRRLARCFVDYPDLLATVFVDGSEMCYVEVTVLVPDDGVSEWRYWFFHSGAPVG